MHVTGAGDGSGRLFVVELSGKIWIVQNGVVLPTPFIDLFPKLDCGDGRLRLLSLAFPPGFGHGKQHFYVKHLDKSCNVVIARYRTTADPNIADPSSEQIVLSKFVGDGLFGGPIYFGPDGYLYVSLGDGSHSDTDNNNNAQASDQILGKVLRLDVETDITGTYTSPPTNPFIHPNDGVRDEIWARGPAEPMAVYVRSRHRRRVHRRRRVAELRRDQLPTGKQPWRRELWLEGLGREPLLRRCELRRPDPLHASGRGIRATRLAVR